MAAGRGCRASGPVSGRGPVGGWATRSLLKAPGSSPRRPPAWAIATAHRRLTSRGHSIQGPGRGQASRLAAPSGAWSAVPRPVPGRALWGRRPCQDRETGPDAEGRRAAVGRLKSKTGTHGRPRSLQARASPVGWETGRGAAGRGGHLRGGCCPSLSSSAQGPKSWDFARCLCGLREGTTEGPDLGVQGGGGQRGHLPLELASRTRRYRWGQGRSLLPLAGLMETDGRELGSCSGEEGRADANTERPGSTPAYPRWRSSPQRGEPSPGHTLTPPGTTLGTTAAAPFPQKA